MTGAQDPLLSQDKRCGWPGTSDSQHVYYDVPGERACTIIGAGIHYKLNGTWAPSHIIHRVHSWNSILVTVLDRLEIPFAGVPSSHFKPRTAAALAEVHRGPDLGPRRPIFRFCCGALRLGPIFRPCCIL